MAASVAYTGKSNRRTRPNAGVVRAYEKAVRDAQKRKAAEMPK